jgi:hypothetical protein
MLRNTTLTILLVCAAAGFLSGCADTDMPRWLTGEPPRAEIESYQGPIAMPPVTVEEKSWPNLADVPPRPVLLMKPDEKAELAAELRQENAVGQAAVADYAHASAPEQSVKKPAAKQKKSKKKKAQKK